MLPSTLRKSEFKLLVGNNKKEVLAVVLEASRSDLEDALEKFDARHRGSDEWTGWTGKGNHKYAIRHDGKLYPVKMIVSMATDRPRNSFHGGAQANTFVEKLGFEITELDGELSPTDGGVKLGLRDSFEKILSRYLDYRHNTSFQKTEEIWGPFENISKGLRKSGVLDDYPSMTVDWSAGSGNWAKVPWIAVLDERETTTTREGVYVVYLFREDMSGVYATLNQGVTFPKDERGTSDARDWLRNKAQSIRDQFLELEDAGFHLDDKIDLESSPGLGRDYEHSTIAYKLYETGDLPEDNQLLTDLHVLLDVYDQYASQEIENRRKTSLEPVALTDVVSDFGQKLDEANISFGTRHEETVRTFVTSLATKGFVILTGVSGSGKTQIAKQFGNWLGDGKSRLIPVRPDWTGAESLFGYPDALLPADGERRAWHVPGALEFMLEARDTPNQPHLLILDEMNLAHVERYFADVLSGMESDEPCLPNLRKEKSGHYRVPEDEPSRIPFPDNLFVVGTVNVDETTYMFSPKVLDRANTLEFKVETEDLRVRYPAPKDCEDGEPGLKHGFLAVAKDDNWHVEHPHDEEEQFADHLRSLHRLVDGTGFEFAHRTFHEALRFAALYDDAGGGGMHEALDVQVLQKILPRMHGSRRKLEPVLSRLGEFCFELPDTVEDSAALDGEFDPLEFDPEEAALSRSFGKIRRMMRNLRANQFTSFTE